MATYEGRRRFQGAKAPCRGGLYFAPERMRVRFKNGSNRFLVRGYDFCAPPLDVFVVVTFDIGHSRGERAGIGEGSPIEFLCPDVVTRREVPRLDEFAGAVSFDFTDVLGELFGRSGAHDEVHMVGEHVPGEYRNTVLAARLDYSSRDEP